MYLQKEKRIQRKGLQNALEKGEHRVLQTRSSKSGTASINSDTSTRTLSEEMQHAMGPSKLTDEERVGEYSVNSYKDATEEQADSDADKALS